MAWRGVWDRGHTLVSALALTDLLRSPDSRGPRVSFPKSGVLPREWESKSRGLLEHRLVQPLPTMGSDSVGGWGQESASATCSQVQGAHSENHGPDGHRVSPPSLPPELPHRPRGGTCGSECPGSSLGAGTSQLCDLGRALNLSQPPSRKRGSQYFSRGLLGRSHMDMDTEPSTHSKNPVPRPVNSITGLGVGVRSRRSDPRRGS